MSEQTQLTIGKILTGTEQRDAIHFALAPMEAAERVYPGQHVGVEGGKIVAKPPHIGVIDPFLTHPVLPKERCWVMLNPNTVTSLRHNWTHPAFSDESAPKTDSEKWLREYAERAGFSYGALLSGAEEWLETGQGMRYHTDIDSYFYDTAHEFWKHYEAVTGIVVDESKKDSQIFWCSC